MADGENRRSACSRTAGWIVSQSSVSSTFIVGTPEFCEEDLAVELSKVALDGGGSILVEAASGLDGPVKAGRVGDAIHALPVKLSAALEPVAEAARTVLEQLRKAGPATIGVEFGIDLATQAGVVITRAETMCHLKVTLTWSGEHESKSHGEHAGE